MKLRDLLSQLQELANFYTSSYNPDVRIYAKSDDWDFNIIVSQDDGNIYLVEK